MSSGAGSSRADNRVLADDEPEAAAVLDILGEFSTPCLPGSARKRKHKRKRAEPELREKSSTDPDSTARCDPPLKRPTASPIPEEPHADVPRRENEGGVEVTTGGTEDARAPPVLTTGLLLPPAPTVLTLGKATVFFRLYLPGLDFMLRAALSTRPPSQGQPAAAPSTDLATASSSILGRVGSTPAPPLQQPLSQSGIGQPARPTSGGKSLTMGPLPGRTGVVLRLSTSTGGLRTDPPRLQGEDNALEGTRLAYLVSILLSVLPFSPDFSSSGSHGSLPSSRLPSSDSIPGSPPPAASTPLREFLADPPAFNEESWTRLMAVLRAHDSFLMTMPPAEVKAQLVNLGDRLAEVEGLHDNLQGEDGLLGRMNDAEARLYEVETRQKATDDDLHRFAQVAGTVGEASLLEEHIRRGEDHIRQSEGILERAREDLRAAQGIAWRARHPQRPRRRGRGPVHRG